MGFLDAMTRLDDKMGGNVLRPVSDPTQRQLRLEEFLRRRFVAAHLPPVVLQELLYLRQRVDALEVQLQSLTSADGS